VNSIPAEARVEAAVYAISDFVDSLNTTAVAVERLDYYTNAGVNGSLLLDPDCPYNVTFEGEEATAYLGRPWLALPTVSTAVSIAAGGDDGRNSSSASSSNNSNGNSSDSSNQSSITAPRTPWEAGGMRQSFGREGGKSARHVTHKLHHLHVLTVWLYCLTNITVVRSGKLLCVVLLARILCFCFIHRTAAKVRGRGTFAYGGLFAN